MGEYTPDSWVLLKISTPTDFVYKVLGSWRGGYLSGDSWRLNSGIRTVRKNGLFFEIFGYTGSLYRCRTDTYGYSSLAYSVYESLNKKYGGTVELFDSEEAFRWLNGQL